MQVEDDRINPFEAQYGQPQYLVDFFDPMFGTENIGFFSGSNAGIEVEDMCDAEGYHFRATIVNTSKPHYIVECFKGHYFDDKRTMSIYRYYKENPYD